MFGSETLEVAIGLAVLFTLMNLFASAARETIEAWVKERAKLIHDGLAQIFSADGEGSGPTLKEFYETIVISPLFRGAYKGVKGELPSYITSDDFASAILELARRQAKATSGSSLADWVGELKDTRVAEIVSLAYRNGGGDPDRTRAYLEKWFDGQMERVSGWYKRKTQKILLGIGFVSAVLLNVDAIAVTRHLYRNHAMRELIVAHAEARSPALAPGSEDSVQPAPRESAPTASGAPGAGERPASAAPAPSGPATSSSPERIVDELRDYDFPIGWSWTGKWPHPMPQCALQGSREALATTPPARGSAADCALDTIGFSAILLMLAGWVVTALGISLGAPFWFDVLNKVMVIRSTVKPFEKSQPEGSADRQQQQPSAPAKEAP